MEPGQPRRQRRTVGRGGVLRVVVRVDVVDAGLGGGDGLGAVWDGRETAAGASVGADYGRLQGGDTVLRQLAGVPSVVDGNF